MLINWEISVIDIWIFQRNTWHCSVIKATFSYGMHCVKSARIRRFPGPYFLPFGQSKSPDSVQMRGNADQNISEFGPFSRGDIEGYIPRVHDCLQKFHSFTRLKYWFLDVYLKTRILKRKINVSFAMCNSFCDLSKYKTSTLFSGFKVEIGTFMNFVKTRN